MTEYNQQVKPASMIEPIACLQFSGLFACDSIVSECEIP
jgi:hypothetical protein